VSKDAQIAWPSVPEMGIYAIRCKITDQVYVGQSRRIRGRWENHLADLKMGKGCPKLQVAWDQYGKEAFEFSVLEEVFDLDMLTPREQFYIDSLRAASDGLNTLFRVGFLKGYIPCDLTKQRIGAATRKRAKDPEYAAHMSEVLKKARAESSYRHTPEHCQRISLAQRGVLRGPLTEAHRLAIAVGHAGFVPKAAIESNKGRPCSEETRSKIGLANRGRKWTPEQRSRITGRKASSETLQKMSAARKGVPWTPARREAQKLKRGASCG